jgi:peptidoglycan hydrolase-like protein with peptidoglycan-binding domain
MASFAPDDVSRRQVIRPFWGVIAWLPLWFLTACVASQTEAPTAGSARAAYDRILTSGDIQIAEAHLQAFGFDLGPVDGLFTAQTQAAVRAYQRRYGLSVSGLLDRETRLELVPGLDPVPKY